MKTSLIVTVIFFFVYHTQDFWAEYISVWYIIVLIALSGTFLFVLGSFFFELYHSIREKFRSRRRNVAVLITSIVIAITIYAPMGLFKYDWFTAADVLAANREGAANCLTKLQLKKDYTFLESTICFGVERRHGAFRIKNDTIWFASNDDFYEFGTIGTNCLNKNQLHLDLYESQQDTLPYFMILSE